MFNCYVRSNALFLWQRENTISLELFPFKRTYVHIYFRIKELNAKVSACLEKKLIILISQSLNLAGKGHLKSSLRGETWDIEHKTNPIQLPRYKVYGEKTWRWYCIHESQFYAYCEKFRISLEESLSLDIFKEYLNNRIWPLQQDQVPHEISQGFCFVQVTRESF